MSAVSDGKKLDEETTDAFGELTDIRQTMGATDDEQFGTKARKKIGDSWPLNPAKVSDGLNDWQALNAASILGTVHLKGIKTVDRQPCLELEIQATANKVDIGIPRDAKFLSCQASVTWSYLLPISSSIPALTRISDRNLAFTTEFIQGGAAARGATEMSEVVTCNRSDFHPAPAIKENIPARN